MATNKQAALSKEIKSMISVANNPKVNDSMRKMLLGAIAKAEKQLKDLQDAEKSASKVSATTAQENKATKEKADAAKLIAEMKTKQTKAKSVAKSSPVTKSAAKKSTTLDRAKALAKKYRMKQKGVPTGGFDIERDAARPALRKGRRVAKDSGKVYYENRENRIDRRPKKYPMLEDGGALTSLIGEANADPRFDINSPMFKKGGKVMRFEDGGFNNDAANQYAVYYVSDNPKYNDDDGFGSNPPDILYADSAFEVMEYLKENMPSDVEIKSLEEMDVMDYEYADRGARLKSALMRDRAYKSNQPFELAYHRKTSPKNPRYNHYEVGGALTSMIGQANADPRFDINSPMFKKGGLVVTSIKDIPNFKKRLEEGKITYRGLGLGKLWDDFYKVAKTTGVRIKVDGKEYFITDEEFNTFSRDSKNKMQIRFDAPYRKWEKGGLTGDVHSITDKILSQKIQIFLDKVKPFKFYYIDGKTLYVGFGENFTTDQADKFYKEASSSKEFFDADSVNMKFNPETNDTIFCIDLKKEVKYAKGGWIVDEGVTSENKKYYFLLNKKNGDKRGLFNTKEEANKELKMESWKMFDYTKKRDGGVMAKGGGSKDIEDLWRGYASAILFAENDSDTEDSLDKNYSISDFDNKTVDESKKLLTNFYNENKDAIKDSGMDLFTVGSDVWYTRAGHGAGFFDHSLDNDIESKLIKGANKLGEYPSVETYDGKISVSGGRVFAKGGMNKTKKTTFKQKSAAIAKSLLEKKKVPKRLKKDYGKTYNKKEATIAANRITGAMRAKELLKKK